MRSGRKTYTKIIIAVLACMLVGFLSSFATQSSVDTWYAGLNKPAFNPPNWVFAPVWSVLYLLMGVSAGLVWARGFHHKWVKTALYLFGFQLLYNATWSMVFFGLRRPLAAFIILVVLLVLILLTIRQFRVVNRTAANLLIPYLLWVIFAGVLNFEIVRLN